ncbi:forkhead associated (FHA) domain within N-terminal region and central coil domain [Cryptosporidium sp. chipmunk genotype I]|uniref:forkhead associated (FHA) domain within N-terminal region and central coil domain n=1 Tax=Cryptosporidium sp. chipmunk genotype I TaxID=1280935 RepID=UPI003519DF52|nr:forkhead associated (FHA) domain within N-terminal region and central coil domain [Cryptosporidium sp. chipmunk genotype I]
MYWWLNPIPPCCDPSLLEPVKLPFGESDEFNNTFSGLEKSKFVFGRKGDCSIRLKDQSISGHHCTIHVDNTQKGLLLTDTSTNGTFLNGKRLSKSVPTQVTDGDVISLTRPKIMDDNIAFHAVFKLVFSSKNPGLSESEPLIDTTDVRMTESLLDSKVSKAAETCDDMPMEDSTSKNFSEKPLEETSSGKKESTNITNNERKSTRSSMSLRSQERKGRLSTKDEGKAEEHVIRRSRGRPRTSDRPEVDEVISFEEESQIRVDKQSIECEKSTEVVLDKDEKQVKEKEQEKENKTENKGNTLKDERKRDREEAVKFITEVEKLNEKHNLSVESISQLFDSATNDIIQQPSEIRNSVVSQKLDLTESKELDKRYSVEGNSLAFSGQRQQIGSSGKRTSDELMEKLENLELMVGRKESLERTLRSELEAREEEISRLREVLDRSEVNEQQLRQQNMALLEELQKVQRQNLDLEHELIDFQERCRVLNASGEAMDQTIAQLSEDLSSVRQELLSMNEKYNQQSLALKSVTQLTQRKCLSILHSLKDIHQLSNTYASAGTGVPSSGGSFLGSSCTGFSSGSSTLTPWRNGKRSLSTNYGYNGALGMPQTERPYKMRSSPISSSRSNAVGIGDATLSRKSSLSGNNYSSFSDDFDGVRNSVLGSSNSQCLPNSRFLSGSSQLEEQLVSSIKPSSFDVQNLGLNINKSGGEQVQIDEEPKSSKTISHNDSEDRSIAIPQSSTSSNALLEKVPTISKSRKSSIVESSLELESVMNKENSIGNI